ncbi:hypothetical protein RhiirA4_411215 [Rhizophagus irregularis]|uniref:Uncharacterized protein n=1 Tax=Rhizophagus irregularis TaxID=588596 RepID=A0A2I1HCA2_9GLOM|nr:hypothetical protein RhiirA4_411215 [Rhizophagus irregularis]
MVAVSGATEWHLIIDKKEKKEPSVRIRIVTSSDDGEQYVTKEGNNEHITTSTEGKYITKFTSGGEDIIEYITTLTGGVTTKTTINGEEYEFITSELVEPGSEPEPEPEPKIEREYITESEKSEYIINTIGSNEYRARFILRRMAGQTRTEKKTLNIKRN